MKVKIGNTYFDSDDQPIMVVLSDIDKRNITQMAPDSTKYCCYGKGHDMDEIESWMHDTKPVLEAGIVHVDDFIHSMDHDDKPEVGDGKYARWVLMHFRMPAYMKIEFSEFMNKHKLFCTFEGKRYRCTGASRMGDVWLTSDFLQDTGYEKRVAVNLCTKWDRSGDVYKQEGWKCTICEAVNTDPGSEGNECIQCAHKLSEPGTARTKVGHYRVINWVPTT